MPISALSNLGNGMFVVFFNNKPDIRVQKLLYQYLVSFSCTAADNIAGKSLSVYRETIMTDVAN